VTNSRPIRALIAEDSVTTLELLSHMLESAPDIQVVGRARNGAEAVDLNKSLKPNVIVMDIHMPIIDGFEATRRIMSEAPAPIVIVSATVDTRAIDVSLQALRLGALTVMPKPSSPADPNFDEESQRFVATVRAMAGVKVVRHWARPSRPPPTDMSPAHVPPDSRPQVVAIATSTGGPAALLQVLSELPADFPAPVLMVQHMSPGFVEGLASWLDAASPLRVKVAQSGERLASGCAYLAPDGHHIAVADRRSVLVSAASPVGGFRPSGTVLFDSVAAVFGAAAIGVILTGMGNDGCAGLATLRRAGGRIIAQDEMTSVVFGMPAAAIAAGLAHVTLPIERIAARLVAWCTPSPQVEREKGTDS